MKETIAAQLDKNGQPARKFFMPYQITSAAFNSFEDDF
jgi:hypothetical protein